MGMDNAIIIKQSYFNGIKVAIDAMNEFFGSGFTTKNFPTVGEEYDLDPTIERIITRLDAIDPTWLKDETKYSAVINMINEAISKIDPENGIYQTIIDQNNEALLSAIDGYVGIKMLNAIADHFDDFTKLINGIYTFELFTKTSQFTEAINQFSQFLQWNEIPELDLEEKIFDEGAYVQGIFKEGLITLPDTLTIESETERIVNRQDLQGVDIYVDDEEDTVQEAAEINYFASYKPAHMKYNNGSRKFIISNEFEAVVNDFISGLRKCDSTDDLKNFFNESMSKYAKMFSRVIVPFILVKVLTNPKKCSVDYDKEVFKRYTDSYRSILDQNTGARRFENYDIFTTFKTDKEGTIKFIDNFFKLKLVNDKDAAIANNTLLTLFNIFDSRIYLDIVYNLAPEAIKNEQNENQFVTSTRAGINKNSRSQNAYTEAEPAEDNKKEDKKPETPEAVTEYVSKELDKLGDMSISDMRYNEHFQYLIQKEIDTLDQKLYNQGISAFDVCEYIGESFTAVNPEPDEFVMEANITKRRETLQSTIASLMTVMEDIVELDNRHAWNNNTLSHWSSTTAGGFLFLFPKGYGSSKMHTDIKQAFFQTKKAVKGKTGGLTPEQKRTLAKLHDYVGNIWREVKMFWVNPLNLPKKFGLLINDKKSNVTKNIARNAHAIVALKPKLEFLQDEDFITEAWYDGSPDYIYQEATTEANRERLNSSIVVVINDMKKISEINKQKAWTNNEAISTFARKNKIIVDIKQAIKYANRARSATAAGKLDDSQKSTLENLVAKLTEILKTASFIRKNPLIGKNVKTADSTKKIAMLADEIIGMESSLAFAKDKPVEDRTLPHPKKGTEETKSTDDTSSDTTTTESFEVNIPTFEEFIAEAYDGSVPNYMRERFKISDKLKTTLEKADVPDIPYNPVPDLVDSINTKVDTSGDQLDSMLGSGFEESEEGQEAKKEGTTVINITYNYTNSFNKNSNNTTDDHSTGKKTITNTTVNGTGKGSNNNNNSNGSVDTKDSDNSSSSSNKKKLSSGKTIEEMFALLESKEPQSIVTEASDVPKETLLTKAYDRDKKSLAKQQENKRKAQTVAGTTKAVFKPTLRLKNWLTGMVDSLINRDEDKVKHELLENPSYRSAVFKAMRLALRAGLIGVAFSIQPWLGVGLFGANVARAADKQRLKKELRRELETELKIIDQKIEDLGRRSYSDDGANQEKYKLMRMKNEIQKKLVDLGGSATAFGKTRDSMYY